MYLLQKTFIRFRRQGNPKKNKGVLGFGERLAAKAAAIAKKASQAIQAVRRLDLRTFRAVPMHAPYICRAFLTVSQLPL